MQQAEFVEAVRAFKLKLLEVKYDDERRHMVIGRRNGRLGFCVQFTESGAFPYLYFRTTSWDWDGERTDLNDVLSVLPATFFRVTQPYSSCTLYDVQNPVVETPECEVYARYIAFGQPEGTLSLSVDGLARLKSALDAFLLYELSVPLFIEFDPDVPAQYTWEDAITQSWVASVQAAFGRAASDDDFTYMQRTNPHWKFYRSAKEGASVVCSPRMAGSLRTLVASASPWSELDGPTMRFYKSAAAHNAATHDAIARATKVLERLEGPSVPPTFIPLENRLIALGAEHVLILQAVCDRSLYNEGRAAVVERQRAEHKPLFDGRVYAWAPTVAGARFEAFVRDLLSREPGMVQVRQSSVTNEGDAGADLICEWNVASVAEVPQPDRDVPLERRRIVVQCKAWTRAVGKSDIPDIRDTLERHDASGILVVALASRRSLAEHLTVLRKHNVWAETWTRADIEDRLDASPDLIQRYSDVVTYDPQM